MANNGLSMLKKLKDVAKSDQYSELVAKIQSSNDKRQFATNALRKESGGRCSGEKRKVVL